MGFSEVNFTTLMPLFLSAFSYPSTNSVTILQGHRHCIPALTPPKILVIGLGAEVSTAKQVQHTLDLVLLFVVSDFNKT